MSPLRRRSARLASSLKAPRAAATPRNLSALVERDESYDEPTQSLNAVVSSPPPKTPVGSSPVKPPLSEMHPSKVHPTMAAAPSSGLRLGFTDIKPAEHPSRDQPSGVTQSTPSKVALPSSPFTFRFTRPNSDMALSGEAQRMMDELREEALKIKADLAAQREQERLEEDQVNGRKIARPKGKASRYSAVHMAEFKKMDSIENHPSAFRGQPGRFTPLTKGVKRSQSKANLEDSESVRAKDKMPVSPSKNSNLFNSGQKAVPKNSNLLFDNEPTSAAKRARQHIDDDASSSRPVSRDGSFLPRPKTAGKDFAAIPRSQTLASLMTPTKASLARAASVKSPVTGSLIKSPSKSELSGLKKSVTTNNLLAGEAKEEKTTQSVTSPGRFDKVKSILRGHRNGLSKAKSALPLPSALVSNAQAHAQVEKHLSHIPLTTPRRKLTKRVAFTPDTKRAALIQNSPSSFKSAIPRSETRNDLGEVHYPVLDTAMIEKEPKSEVTYPDLSAHRPLPEPPSNKARASTMAPPTVPGTFTFRSDHTIHFGSTSPTGFGSSPGQVSLRHVRPSIMPTGGMPGSFPSSMEFSGADKENKNPTPVITAAPHGISNKKRHRISEAEEEAEQQAAERAAKKRKNEPVPEGDALLAPRLMGMQHGLKPSRFSSPKKPSQIARLGGSSTPSPVKKKPVLSLSRLNMLARPKLRK